jgi:acylphosphatase
MVKRIRAIIVGKVQGVFYRARAREKAMALELTGFVRNLPNGSVELEAEGEDRNLESLLLWCQHGPPGARVDDIQVEGLPPQGGGGPFLITG